MKFLKGLSAVAVSVVMMFSVTDVNVFAATTTQDGLEFSLTTDKEAYVRDENIFVTVKVTNNNSVSVENIAIENLVPDNYHISDDTVVHKMIPYLGAGETAELNTTFVYTQAENEESSKEELSKEESSKEESSKEESSKEESSKEESSKEESSKEESSKEESSKEESSKEESSKENNLVITNSDNNAVKTGDSGLNIFVIVLPILISAITIVICIKKRKGKKLLSLLLCTSVAGTMVVYGGHIKSSAVENNDDYSVILEEIASIDGSNLSISSTVKYDRIATVFSTQYDGMGNIDSSDPEIEIYDFSADIYNIPVGEEKEVTFTAEIFSDVVLTDKTVSVVNKYGDIIGYMNDNGVDGDMEGEDGIYSLKTSLNSDTNLIMNYYIKAKNYVSKGIMISYYSQISNLSIKECESIVEDLDEIVLPYLDDTQQIEESNVPTVIQLLSVYVDRKCSDEIVEYYYVNNTSLTISLYSGYTFGYCLPVKDVSFGNSEVGEHLTISTFRPYKNEDLLVADLLVTEATSVSAGKLQDEFDYWYTRSYENEEINIELMKHLSDYNIILWDGHGEYNQLFGTVLMTREKVENPSEYSDDIHGGKILAQYSVGKTAYYGITGLFIRHYVEDMSGAFVYLGACHSGHDVPWNTNEGNPTLISALVDEKNASTVIGNTDTINTYYNAKMQRDVIDYMCKIKEGGEYYTVSEALELAKVKNGENDLFHGAYPKISGDENFTFSSGLVSNHYGTISGKIIDSESGYGIKGALVRIYKDGRLVSKVRTDSHGNYSDDMLRPGNYVLKITDSYYHSAKLAVTVNANETTYNETVLMFKVVNNPVQRAYGIINNAVNGMAVPSATVKVRQNWNNKIGEIITEVDTDENGKYDIELREGFYTLEVSKKDYITGYGSIVVGSLGMFSQDISISPVISDSTYRVVLTWNDNPSDLDSHLFGKVNGKYDYHIYYNEQSESDGEKIIANLDRDDTDGNGPETTVFETLPNGEYDYYIDWYSGLGTWSSSGGKIDIYSGNDLIKTLNVPNADHQNGSWKVFSVKNGVFTVYNTIQDEDIYVD